MPRVKIDLTPYRQYFSHAYLLNVINFKISKFPWLPSWAYSSSKSSESSLACRGGCYPWHGSPFNLPSDVHSRVKNNILGFQRCVNTISIQYFKFKEKIRLNQLINIWVFCPELLTGRLFGSKLISKDGKGRGCPLEDFRLLLVFSHFETGQLIPIYMY